jgi:putative nucleotidyltransferase with HDIG domain
MPLSTTAEDLAQAQLASELPTRWNHVRGVAAKARAVGHSLGAEADVLEAAAWLHDIGYSPNVAETGFHPLDGARFLRKLGFDERVTRLVAHHSCAITEARERGLGAVLSGEFDPEESLTADLLWFCDMTVGPAGQELTIEERLAEIDERYGRDHLVARSIARARRDLLSAVQRAEVFLVQR